MTGVVRAVALVVVFLGGVTQSSAVPQGRIAFAVSMQRPSAHYFHVAMTCEGLKGEVQELKMPLWTPGYYMMMDYHKNVMSFRVEDQSGNSLAWEKTAKNTWRVRTETATAFTASYDVYAFGRSVAESSLDDSQAVISPTSLFMYVSGLLQHPVSVTVDLPPQWRRIDTGLAPVPGQARTFGAEDFDVLYDSPILLGNQEALGFEVRGIPHSFVAATSTLGTLDRPRFVSDLKAMVESAVALMGDIPYRRYVFLAIGPGGGGLEHLDSQLITFSGDSMGDPAGYQRTMSFISHEYFHHYNVKRIRPVALGPFDYERENYTHMLWVSEGFTLYYEDIVLARAGFYTPEQVLGRLAGAIGKAEGAGGRRYMSATESSFDAWSGYFNRNEHQLNTTISYYDRGCVLALLLDFKIRHETKNQKSLDDVMRTLYKVYYREMRRGFTDLEFREVCERVAGCPLPEIFDRYAATTQDVDYATYLGYGGLELLRAPDSTPGAFLGASFGEGSGPAVVSRVGIDSPAFLSGLSSQDEILAVDGVRLTTATGVEGLLKSRKPTDTIRVLLTRRGRTRELDVVLGGRLEPSYRLKPVAAPDPLQAAIYHGWLQKP